MMERVQRESGGVNYRLRKDLQGVHLQLLQGVAMHIIVRQGYLEVSLLTTLICLNYNYALPQILSLILVELFICFTSGSGRKIGLAFSLLVMALSDWDGSLVLFLYFVMTVCFPMQNFFEISLFALILAGGHHHLFPQQIINYLIDCLIIQLCIIACMVLTKTKKYIYEAIIISSVGMGLYSIHTNLHMELFNSPHLVQVMVFGALGLLVTVLTSLTAKHYSISNTYLRKVFHLPPLVMFPLFDHFFPDIFATALVGVIYLFVALELLRYYSTKRQKGILLEQFRKVWDYMLNFVDNRDEDLWVTHLSLLTGMAISYTLISHPVIRNASVVIPLGDAMAAVVGKSIGRMRIGDKSLQGMLAFVVSSVAVLGVGSWILGMEMQWRRVGMAMAATALVQLLTAQIDNLYLPLFFSYLYRYV